MIRLATLQVLITSILLSNNNHPIILVHGFLGWGKEELGDKNYWGGENDNESIKVSLGETENNITVRIKHFAVGCEPTDSNCDSSSGEGYHETTVQNIPLQKWVNLTISTFGKSLDIYLNGKLYKTDVLPNLPKPDVLGNIMITPDGGFSGWTTNFLYTPSPTNPQQAYNIYKKGYGGSMLGNLFNKYRLRVQVLADSEVTGGFEL